MSVFNLLKHLKEALKEWNAEGRPIVSATKLSQRLTTCRACPHWSEIKKTKIAKCRICGCSALKLLMETSKCPLSPPKW